MQVGLRPARSLAAAGAGHRILRLSLTSNTANRPKMRHPALLCTGGLLALLLLATLPGASACAQHYWAHGRLLAELVSPTKPQSFSYVSGGSSWTGLCSSGQAQSPIGIRSEQSAELPPEARAQLEFGVARGLRVFNTGHAVQVEWDRLEGSNATVPILGDEWGAITGLEVAEGGSGSLDIRQVPVKPLQIHWHSTCEHLVDGTSCPMELHIVTRVDNTTGMPVPARCNQAPCLAVFGVTLRYQPEVYAAGDPFLDLVLSNVPNTTGAQAATLLEEEWVDLSSLLPQNDQTYATYSGSLTTPPCTEGVLWHVFLAQKAELSAQQVNAYQTILASTLEELPVTCAAPGAPAPAPAPAGSAAAEGGAEQTCTGESGGRTNNRNVQALNNRTVLLSPSF